jgi:hypothetical protein
VGLQAVLYVVDEEQHDCLGDAVLYVLAHDVKVRRNQRLCGQAKHAVVHLQEKNKGGWGHVDFKEKKGGWGYVGAKTTLAS